MKKYELTPAGKEFAKKVAAYQITKLDVTKPYKASPAIKPSAPKPPVTRFKGEEVIPGKRIPNETRDALRKDYLFGTETNEELADKYGIHPNTIYNLAERENWPDLKEMLSLDTQIVALGERLIEVIQERMAAPGALEVSLDQPPLPPDEDDNNDDDREDETYETAAEETDDEDDDSEEPDDGSLKWSF